MSETVRPTAPTVRTSKPITTVKTIQELFDHPGLKDRMADLVPKHLDVNRLLRTFMSATLKTPGLAKASPLSMLGCAMTIGYLGLEPNTPLGLIYLIPFEVNTYNRAKKEWEYVRTDVTPIIGYEGYLELIGRGGHVKDVDCQLIWPGDVVHNERGSNRHFQHIEKHQPHAPDQEPDFAYMFARTVNGGEYLEMMNRAEVHAVRNMSQGYRTAIAARDAAATKGWNPPKSFTEAPWIKHFGMMWRKTPLRRGQRFIPGRTPELAMAAALDEAGDAGRVRFDHVLDVDQVIEGSWDVPPEDTGDAPDPTPTNRNTQVQGATVGNSENQQEPKTEPEGQQRKPAPAKRAASAKQAAPPQSEQDGPPDDGRWPSDEPTNETRPLTTEAGGPSAPVSSDAALPAAGGQPPDQTAAGEPFDAWVLDENGEPLFDGPEADAVTFASRLEERWRGSPNRESLIQQNADGMQDARAASDAAAAILDSLEEPAEEAGVICVEVTKDRSGQPDLRAYLKAFKAEVATLTAANYGDFVELNRATLISVAPSSRALCIKDLVQKADALGVARPVLPVGVVQPAVAGKAAPPGGTVRPIDPVQRQPEPPQQETPPTQPADPVDMDWRMARNRIDEIKACKDIHEVNGMADGIVIKNFAARLQREGKTDIVAALKEAFDAKRAALRPG